MNSTLKVVLKKIIPKFFRVFYSLIRVRLLLYFIVFNAPRKSRKIIERLKNKSPLIVLFLPANLAMWKYDYLFEKLREHPRFSPMILLSLPKSLPAFEVEETREQMLKHFSKKGFPVVSSELAGTLKPDIVFITQGYSGFAEFGSENFPDALICYSPYSYPTAFSKNISNLPELNKLWRLFDTTEEHARDAASLMTNHGINIRVTGYANADYFLDKNKTFAFPWREQSSSKKKIIYAPHWTIAPKNTLAYATFLQMGEIMLKIAQKFSAKTQWCFKPHPWLFRALCQHPEWGEERAKKYFDAWKNLSNAVFSNGDYIDLFMTSDAMIHDSGSFRCEYFYTQNPIMHLVRDGQLDNDGNIGKIAFNAHYHGRSREDIEKFIEDVVLGGNDSKSAERRDFLIKYLAPPPPPPHTHSRTFGFSSRFKYLAFCVSKYLGFDHTRLGRKRLKSSCGNAQEAIFYQKSSLDILVPRVFLRSQISNNF